MRASEPGWTAADLEENAAGGEAEDSGFIVNAAVIESRALFVVGFLQIPDFAV
jgi:hypothetical protein